MAQFLGNSINKSILQEFLGSSLAGGIIVLGPCGGGKTTFCSLVFDEFKDTRFLKLKLEHVETHKQLVDHVHNFLTSDDVGILGSPINRVIFIDDIDILFTQDRYANTFLQSLIKDYKLVCTCSTGEERRSTELKKKCKIIRLDPPPLEDVVQLFGEDKRTIAKLNECNIGHMLRGNNNDLKYFDKNIYQLVENIFSSNDGIYNLEQAISSDPTLISFMMYDNYKKFFTPLPCANLRITKLYADTSVLEDFAFCTSDWNLIEVLNLVRCQNIRIEMDLAKKHNKKHEISYTQITSRSAQHYSINKKIALLSMLNYENIALLSEMMYAKKIKPDLKTNIGMVCNAYIFNFCKL